jgi:Flp pilus assembly protein TadG
MKNHLQNNNRVNCRSECGSVLVLVALTVFLIVAMVGLAMDAGQLYAVKQRAVAAADAAAQAAVMDIYDATSTDHGYSTALWYTRQNGFNTAADAVTVTYPGCPGLSWCNGHVALSGIDTPNLVEVTVSRTVNTALLRILGPTVSTVSATADAAIVLAPAPLPIIVTHPTLSNAVDTGGNKSGITVCGGPQRAFQINSNSPTAINNPGIDLSHAGPASDGSCADAVAGADLAVVGGPVSLPSNVTLGVNGSYQEPASTVPDPFASVNPPVKPGDAPAPAPLVPGQNGCLAGETCTLYSPGNYSSAIDVQHGTALFKPGIYYISSGGFSCSSNGVMRMATGLTDPTTGWAGHMMVYNTGPAYGAFNLQAGAVATLVGSPSTSAYEGILFFQDRNSPALTHQLQGGGVLNLTGTIYITNSLSVMQANPSQYQTLSFGGHSGSTTQVIGEIVTSAISMNGSTTLKMYLTSTPTRDVRQVALVR